MPESDVGLGSKSSDTDELAILAGLIIFLVMYFLPEFPSVASDQPGKTIELTREGRGALGLVLAGGVWLAFSSMSVGVIGLMFGMVQGLFLLRPAGKIFGDFTDPSIIFIIGSLSLSAGLIKTGLVKRIVFYFLFTASASPIRMYLALCLLVALLSHFLLNSVLAASIFPILWFITDMNSTDRASKKPGKELFFGLTCLCSIAGMITLFAAPRSIISLSILRRLTGSEPTFLDFSYYMAPIGWLMVGILALTGVFLFKPHKVFSSNTAHIIHERLIRCGKISSGEVFAGVALPAAISLLSLQSFVPLLAGIDKASLLLVPGIFLFITRVLDLNDFNSSSWNLILLCAGSLSLSFCLLDTGAAQWAASIMTRIFANFHNSVFLVVFSLVIFLLSNVIANVFVFVVLAPVAMLVAIPLGVSQLLVVFALLVASGLPGITLEGASLAFVTYTGDYSGDEELYRKGAVISSMMLLLLLISILIIWPEMGLKV